MSIVIVSAIFNNEEDITQNMAFFEQTDCPVFLFTDINIPNIGKNITLHPLSSSLISFTLPLYLDHDLPMNRSTSKDTRAHLINGHAKVACMAKTVELYEYTPDAFMWIDFNAPCQLFDNISYFIKSLTLKSNPFQMTIPVCFKHQPNCNTENYCDSINWRFCGTIMWGSHDAVRIFWKLYETQFANFMKQHNKLTWEVNFWAWLESHQISIDPFIKSLGHTIHKNQPSKLRSRDKQTTWTPITYVANHNTSLFKHISSKFQQINCLSNSSSCTILPSYNYPHIDQYVPSSASFISSQDRRFLNTRFVNYFINTDGSYRFLTTDQSIHTRNIICELDKNCVIIPNTFRQLMEFDLPNFGGSSQGWEDVRLFEENGKLCIIASNLNHVVDKKIRMAIGTVNPDTGYITDAKIINPPTNTNCEKNWIPVHRSTGITEFIYQWCPMQIGTVNTANKLDIVRSFPTNPYIFDKIRGSSCFVPVGDQLVGVVHFSEDWSVDEDDDAISRTRRYYHRLVALDKETLKPIRYSDIFTFFPYEKFSDTIEFCIGFNVEYDDQYVFWISRMDRSPTTVRINCGEMIWCN